MMASVFSEKAPRTLPQAMRSLPMLVCLLLLLSCADGGRMRRDLDALEARNQSDSLLTDSALALRLADYFDRHGTPNERLHAHYLLARTWADLGQAPRALDEFHRAAEQADTTSSDCDYRLLSRVHGQMGGLFDSQIIPYEAISEFSIAARYAKLANDTVAALAFNLSKMRPYEDLGLLDSMVALSLEGYHRFLQMGDTFSAAYVLAGAIHVNLTRNHFNVAKEMINLYSKAAHEKRDTFRIAYTYSYMGKYYIGINRADSAILYFQKELDLSDYGRDHLVVAHKGLFDAYSQLGIKDSINKYCQLYCSSNDSTVIFKSNTTMQRMQALYNYNHFKSMLSQKIMESFKLRVLIAILFLVLVAIISIMWHLKYRKDVQLRIITHNYMLDLKKYQAAVEKSNKLQSEVEQNKEIVEKSQEEVERLAQIVASYQEDKAYPEQWTVDNDILLSDIVGILHQKGSFGPAASLDEWSSLVKLVFKSESPFVKALTQKREILNERELLICILVWLRFLPAEMATLLDISNQIVTNTRTKLLKKLFGIEKGGAKKFDYMIKSFPQKMI